MVQVSDATRTGDADCMMRVVCSDVAPSKRCGASSQPDFARLAILSTRQSLRHVSRVTPAHPADAVTREQNLQREWWLILIVLDCLFLGQDTPVTCLVMLHSS